MHQPKSMSRIEPRNGFHRDAKHQRRRWRLEAFDQAVERLAGKAFHRDIRRSIDFIGFINRHNIVVFHTRCGSRFPNEASLGCRLQLLGTGHDFQRDHAFQSRVGRGVNHTHAPPT